VDRGDSDGEVVDLDGRTNRFLFSFSPLSFFFSPSYDGHLEEISDDKVMEVGKPHAAGVGR